MTDLSDGNSAALSKEPPVVGLGASAGGVKALSTFFSNVPPNSGAAYVVVLHLSPSHDSHLAEVLQHHASIPITQVTNQVRMEPDHAYVVAPSKSLEVVDGMLVVSDLGRPEQRRSPIDLFMRTLAVANGANAVGVVLSGTGPDGSVGLKRVKELGGLVLAQDPAEAEYADMPRNAIATGFVDLVLPVAEMPSRIAEFHERLRGDQVSHGDGLQADPAPPIDDAEDMRDILALLRTRTSHDFSNYKSGTLYRRVRRRVHLLSLPSLTEYLRHLHHDPDESDALMKELLISVTSFFRDAPVFETLAARVVPGLFNGKRPGDQVRVWVPGCATGEEAYSIAMLLAEFSAPLGDQPSIQIFATDLDQAAIEFAREGLYTTADVIDLSEERLAHFFQREVGGFRVRRSLRETVLFAHHNVIRDPPFSHLDLISCRNVFIYLNQVAQERTLETFHFALRPGGALLLGASESPDSMADLFIPIDRVAHLYESRPTTSRVTAFRSEDFGIPRAAARERESRPKDRFTALELHQQLLERYAPPSLVITPDYQIVHLSEHAGQYLEIGAGEPSRDLMRLLKPELRPELRAALHHAGTEGAKAEVANVQVMVAGVQKFVNVVVRPIARDGDAARGYFLVIFDDVRTTEPTASAQTITLGRPNEPIAQHLEQELARLKTHLRTTTEQYETEVEESKASNEELQAMNEELRSAAEELETSKEELQSVNEELTTVNQELKIKIEELKTTNDDFQNLINSSEVGTIFVDRELRVKLSTPVARSIFNLRDADAGRSLADITSQLLDNSLIDDCRVVLARLQRIDREVGTRDGRWFLMQLRPYRTLDDRIGGVVISFLDISARRRAELDVRRSEERFRLLIDSAIDYAIFTITDTGQIDSWNSGAERMFGYRSDEIIGRGFEILFTPEDRAAGVHVGELHRATSDGRGVDERYHVRKDGSRLYCSGITTPLAGPQGGFTKIARDLTAQREADESLERARSGLESRVAERTAELRDEVIRRAAAQDNAFVLLRKLVSSQEDERARIARDLHDQLGQQLTALRLTLERYRERTAGGGKPHDDIERALTLARQIDMDLDFLAWELRPALLDDLGLAATLPRFVTEWSSHYGVPAEYRANGYEAGHLTRDAEVAFYRVTQEALTNIAKHAHASRADVILESRDGSVVLVVEDDGVGFDQSGPEPGGLGVGMTGMRERATLIGATLQIESRPGDGTSVFLRCPMAVPPPRVDP